MSIRKWPTATIGLKLNFSEAMAIRSKHRWVRCLMAWAFRAKTLNARSRNSPAAGRCAWVWPSCFCRSPICCCSTSRPITSIWRRAIHSSFPQPRSSGRMVAELRNVAKSYGEKRVFDSVSFVLNRGDRVALVGVNGAGKSTLIKLLSGAEPVTKGESRLGHNVELDYFAQDQYKVLDPQARLIDDLTSFAPKATRNQTQLRTLLGSFLFSDDDVFKRIGVLSGGERNRYALARMLLRPANFLLLDEPTNHLDLQAQDVLLEALRKFTGTIVFVSHDRYFIDKLATRIFEIEGGKLQDYSGNYEHYLWQKQRRAAGQGESTRKAGLPQAASAVRRRERGERGKRPNPKLIC